MPQKALTTGANRALTGDNVGKIGIGKIGATHGLAETLRLRSRRQRE